MMTPRQKAEWMIDACFYGFPPDNPLGALSLDILIKELGAAALTDEAIIRLAKIQETLHQVQLNPDIPCPDKRTHA
jgi:hypothetical protein